ncbi:PPC domain-containing DNA-binding protein [Loktanella sp. SALINAS62]|uniref:PPC domain-containing DNA-binding protein n=1 Tax=Loktanella sp. SALINAS62 TaxID=2706124 RepID=UPI001B8BA445|nr:PPC domain-containing DNA-binding protein [Loktanella sp. SALINAS62]MBS1303314.1 DNA-binding protein [Loktanella sp. SALINAS62]
METRLLNDQDGLRTFVVVLRTGDEVMACLQEFAAAKKLSAAQITALGAFETAGLRYFDWSSKEYLPISVSEQTEVATLVGDIALDEHGNSSLHLHAVLGKRDGTALAGHLAYAKVRPTLEVVVTESPTHLRRLPDRETGLALIRPER